MNEKLIRMLGRARVEIANQFSVLADNAERNGGFLGLSHPLVAEIDALLKEAREQKQ